MAQLDDNIILEFLKLAYFGKPSSDRPISKLACDRAYRDFCRTIRPDKKNENSTSAYNNETLSIVREKVSNYLIMSLVPLKTVHNQEEFDKWHEDNCNWIIGQYAKYGIDFHYGQAQKWINMFLKYLCINKNDTVLKAIGLLHVPIDNIIIEVAVDNCFFSRPVERWSKWDRHTYLKYVKLLNKGIENTGFSESRILWEFLNWKQE